MLRKALIANAVLPHSLDRPYENDNDLDRSQSSTFDACQCTTDLSIDGTTNGIGNPPIYRNINGFNVMVNGPTKIYISERIKIFVQRTVLTPPSIVEVSNSHRMMSNDFSTAFLRNSDDTQPMDWKGLTNLRVMPFSYPL